METLKSLFVKPDPREQIRKCNSTMRAGVRKLDRDIANLKSIEAKTKAMILSAEKRANRDPSQAKFARKEQVAFARELIRTRKQHQRLVTSKAQLNSVNMQINEAFATRKIEGSLKSSVVIMKDVNSLVRLPELTGTMRELSQELMKAGVIEEMVDDMLPEAMVEEDEEEAEGEVDKVLGEILQQKMGKIGATPDLPTAKKDEIVADEEEEDAEAMLDQMRGRLEALKS